MTEVPGDAAADATPPLPKDGAVTPAPRAQRFARSRVALVEAGLFLVVAAALVAMGAWVERPLEDLPGCPGTVRFQLAVPGGADGAGGTLPELPRLAACAGPGRVADVGDALRTSTQRDFGFVLLYVTFLAWCCLRLSGWVPRRKLLGFATTRIDVTHVGRMIAFVGVLCTLVAGLLDVLENISLLRSAGDLESPDALFVGLTAGASIGKWLVLALPIGLSLLAVVRLVRAATGAKRGADLRDRVVLPAGPDRRWQVPYVKIDGDGAEASDATRADSLLVDTSRIDRPEVLVTAPGGLVGREREARIGLADGIVAAEHHRYGICLSGGGIRSATYALGALQEIEELPPSSPWSIGRAQFLTAVSGGSYLAAAHQFLSRGHQGGPPGPAAAGPAAVATDRLLPKAGVVEDHLRRHSTHLADGATEWILAVGEIALKVLYGLAVVLLTIWSVGVPLGWGFRSALHGLDEAGEPTVRVDLRIGLAILLTYGIFAVVRSVAALKDNRNVDPTAMVPSTRRDRARQATVYGTVLVVSLSLVVPTLAANIEQGVSWAARRLGATEPAHPDRKDVLTQLSAIINGAATAGAGAADTVLALEGVAPSGTRTDALEAALATVDHAAAQAALSVEELRARVGGEGRNEPFPLSSELGVPSCSTAAPPGDTSGADAPSAASATELACRAAVAAARAAEAASAVARSAVERGGDDAAAAAATSAANGAAIGATAAADAVLRLGEELTGTGTDDRGEEPPPLAWAGLSALASALGGIIAKRRLDLANRPSGATDTKKRRGADLARRLGFGGTGEVLAGFMTAAVLAIALSDVIADAWRRGPDGPLRLVITLPAAQWWLGGAIALVLALVSVNANKTGLRSFYHRRLWNPYAVTPEGTTAPWGSTDTRLSEAGRRPPGRPELIVCAAAQASGRDHAPPGRRALSYVFTATACGGPEVGYVATQTLEGLLGKRHRQPVTLYGAVTTSGAAFGPAMGRQSKGGLGTVLAIANARLGAWLPNPRRLHEVSTTDGWLRSGAFERWPRLSYWFREMVGQYRLDAGLILTTDGGHVENLGLVELLRRRCDRILAFDASGAAATPTTLAEAIVMAREELGVEITLRPDPLLPDAEPPGLLGSETGADPLRRTICDPASISARLARRPVLVADIHYPEVLDADGNTYIGSTKGVLIYGTLAIADGDPGDWDVLEYAQRHDVFPNDGTDKQWFRANTFSAYQQLGRRTARRMLAAAAEVPYPT